jgi:hypothetical protein
MKNKRSKCGRKSYYSPELADQICEVIANTPKSVPDIIAENPWMPAITTINRWQLENRGGFRAKYLLAKQQQVHEHVNQTIKIADDAIKMVHGVDPRTAAAIVQAAKLQCDVRHWYAGRLAPKIYGDKPEETKHSEDGLTEQERLAKVMGIFAAAKERADKDAE